MQTYSGKSTMQSSNSTPQVSIILPVFNCQKFAGEAIQSILDQTYKDFELIVIDDGSTDNSAEIISSFKDKRICLLRQTNHGLASSLNRGIHIARGIYIARQDQDDISDPRRLELQVAFMESHPKYVLVGTWAQIMEDERLVERYHRHPVDDLTLRYQLLFNNPFVHSSTIIRRSTLLEVGCYTTNPERQPPEDYELWSRLSRVGSIANIGEVLVTYREIQGSMCRSKLSLLKKNLIMLSAENIAVAAGLSPDDKCIRTMTTKIHDDAYQLEEEPDFALMKEILKKAISSLGHGDKLKPLYKDAFNRVQTIRAVWMAHKLAVHPVLYYAKSIKRIGTRFWNLTKNVVKQK